MRQRLPNRLVPQPTRALQICTLSSQQALSSHLKELERRGIISLGYRVITLRKRAVLEQMVNGAAISVAHGEPNPS